MSSPVDPFRPGPGNGPVVIVIAPTPRGLGNQLLVFARAIGVAIEHDIPLVNISFNDTAQLFPATRRGIVSRYPPPKTRIAGRRTQVLVDRLTWRFLQLWPESFDVKGVRRVRLEWDQWVDLEDEDLLRSAQAGLLIIEGFWLRDRGAFRAQAEPIRRFLRPPEHMGPRADATLAPLRETVDVVVGIHMRQGDYRRLMDGQFHYETEEFVAILEGLTEAWPGKRVGFCLTSDQPQEVETFAPHPVVIGPGGPLQDMVLLSKCDVITGPPSTFSLWASFLGDRPLAVLKTSTPPGADDFLSFWDAEHYFSHELHEGFARIFRRRLLEGDQGSKEE